MQPCGAFSSRCNLKTKTFALCFIPFFYFYHQCKKRHRIIKILKINISYVWDKNKSYIRSAVLPSHFRSTRFVDVNNNCFSNAMSCSIIARYIYWMVTGMQLLSIVFVIQQFSFWMDFIDDFQCFDSRNHKYNHCVLICSMVIYQLSADKCAIICGLNHRQVDVGWGKLLDLTWLQDAVLELG